MFNTLDLPAHKILNCSQNTPFTTRSNFFKFFRKAVCPSDCFPWPWVDEKNCHTMRKCEPRACSNNLPNFSHRQLFFRIIIKSQKAVAPLESSNFPMRLKTLVPQCFTFSFLTRYKTAKLSKMQQHSSGRYFSIYSPAGLLDTS